MKITIDFSKKEIILAEPVIMSELINKLLDIIPKNEWNNFNISFNYEYNPYPVTIIEERRRYPNSYEPLFWCTTSMPSNDEIEWSYTNDNTNVCLFKTENEV